MSHYIKSFPELTYTSEYLFKYMPMLHLSEVRNYTVQLKNKKHYYVFEKNYVLQGWKVFNVKPVSNLDQNGQGNKTMISPKV